MSPVKNQGLGVKSQESRVKSQESRVKSQEYKVKRTPAFGAKILKRKLLEPLTEAKVSAQEEGDHYYIITDVMLCCAALL